MSLDANPDFNEYIDRIYDILTKSILLFPHTVGQANDAVDLVKQIIKYNIPDPFNPQGPQYPHIIITTSKTPRIFRQQTGRDSRDAQGPQYAEYEFYLIVIARNVNAVETEKQIYQIMKALTTTLDRNKRLTNPDGNTDPKSATHTWLEVPYVLATSEQKDVIARNLILRPKVYLNLRTD